MKRFLLICGVLFFSTIAFGQSTKIVYGPYLHQVTEDGFTVVWTTSDDAISWVEIAPDDGSHFYGSDRQKFFDSYMGKYRVDRLHRVRVTGLEPGTTYRYRLMQQRAVTNDGNTKVTLGDYWGSDVYMKEPYSVTTLDPSKKEFEFWVVNDIHERDEVFRNLMSEVETRKPDFVCFNGDMVNWMVSEQRMFDGYLQAASEILTPAGIPIVATRGNHEMRGTFSHKFHDYFPTSTGEIYYTFQQGPAFFIVMDCGEDKPDNDIEYGGFSDSDTYRAQEAEWLKAIVESQEYKAAPIHIAIIHMPPGAADGWHGEMEIRRLLVPTLNEASIDVQLCGHYHYYEWIDDSSHGTNFPILINSNNDKLVVKVNSSGIDIDVVNQNGEVIKQHSIRK